MSESRSRMTTTMTTEVSKQGMVNVKDGQCKKVKPTRQARAVKCLKSRSDKVDKVLRRRYGVSGLRRRRVS